MEKLLFSLSRIPPGGLQIKLKPSRANILLGSQWVRFVLGAYIRLTLFSPPARGFSLAGMIVVCTAAGIAALVVAAVCWCR